jgi:hypothetical protein
LSLTVNGAKRKYDGIVPVPAGRKIYSGEVDGK